MVFKIISMLFFMIVAISNLIIGIIYTTKKEFASYHKAAIGKNFNDLEDGNKYIILGLMKLGGAGFLTNSIISLGAICIFWDQSIAFIFISFASFIFCLSGYLITSYVRNNTNGNPPKIGPIINLIAVPAGVIFYILSFL